MAIFDFLQAQEEHRLRRQGPPAHHHRAGTQRAAAAPDYLPMLQRELLEVIRKYVNVDVDAVKVDLVKDGEHDVLDISVALPEERAAAGA